MHEMEDRGYTISGANEEERYSFVHRVNGFNANSNSISNINGSK
jgi:PAB1-binding protein PBP1